MAMTPHRQRVLQRIKALGPERQAIVQPVLDRAGGFFAEEDVRREISAGQSAARTTALQRGLTLAEQGQGLRERGFEFQKETTAGREELSRDRLDLSRQGVGLRQNAADFGAEQQGTAETLGFLNIGASGIAGLADLRASQKRAKRLQRLEESFPALTLTGGGLG